MCRSSGAVGGWVGRGRSDWNWDQETDGEILVLGSERDWFGHFTHTHHTSHPSRVMVDGGGEVGAVVVGVGGVMGAAWLNLGNEA